VGGFQFPYCRAVSLSCEALHLHFTTKASHPSTESREKAKFSGLAKKLESAIFIENLGLMYDALEELSDLSLALQRADINLPVANKLVSRQVKVFAARKTTESGFYKEACDAVEIGLFRGVQVVDTASNSKQREIPKAQFYQALADSIAARLLPNTEKQLCDTVKVVDASSFPPQ